MRKESLWIAVASCALMGGVSAPAQESHKAGLWVVASTTKIQKPGDTPANFGAPANQNQASAPAGGLAVCITPEIMDKYGVILPPSLRDCNLSNIVQTADSFRADMICKGGYNGVGSVESNWTDEDHVVGKVRFVSKTSETTNARALTWTQESTAVFKGSDCGNVKPRRTPVKADAPEKP